jgi:hypothetical protein
MRLIPIILSITILATAAHAQMTGPEIPVSPADYRPAPSHGSTPRLVATGSGFFSAWVDGRGGLYGARLDGHGNLLDPGDLHLWTSPQVANMAISSSGTDAVVVIAHCFSIELIRVGADGSITAPRTIVNGNGTAICSDVGMASNGATFLVAWAGSAEIVDRDGNVLTGPFDTAITYSFAAASNGDGYLLAGITDTGDAVVLTIGSDGRIGTARTVTAVVNPGEVAVASDGSQYVVIIAGNSAGLTAMIVKPDGSVENTATFDDTIPASARVAWNGHEYVVAVGEYARIGPALAQWLRIRLTRLGADGHPIGALTTLDGISGVDLPPQTPFDVAGTPEGALVAWSKGAVLATTMPDTAIDTGTVPAPIALSMSAPDQRDARLIRTNTGIAAIWNVTAGYDSHVEGALLDDGGRPRAVPVNLGNDGFPPSYRIAFDGTNVVVAWVSPAGIFMRRYTTAFQSIDTTPIFVASGQYGFELAAGSGGALVAWISEPSVIESDINGVLLRTTDPFPQPLSVAISRLPHNSYGPAVAWNGSEFLVAWLHELPAQPPPDPMILPAPMADEVLGARVSSDGRLIDLIPLMIASPGVQINALNAASNGDDFYVVWGANAPYNIFVPQEAFEPVAVYGNRVGSDGTTGRADRLSPDTSLAFQPTVVADDHDYLVAWCARVNLQITVDRIEMRRIGSGPNPKLAVFAPTQPLPVLDFPSIAASASGAVIAYGRLTSEQPYGGVSRVFARAVALPPSSRRRAR